MAASRVWPNHEVVGFCEIDPFCQKVLKKHWPGVPIYDDIKKLKGTDFGGIDILTGGFPCQPYSTAGKQRGKEDDRYLWPEMCRIIEEAEPRWVLGENVAGFINMGLDAMLSDLESQGYETTAFVIPACGIGADQKRERIWVVAHSLRRIKKMERQVRGGRRQSEQIQGNQVCQREGEPGMVGMADDVPYRMDRLRSLGNAIVPQVAEQIFKAIKEADK